MSLATPTLKAAITTLLNSIKDWDGTPSQTRDAAIEKIATDLSTAIATHIKTALVTCSIPTGTVIVQVTGGSGAPAVGVPNAAPISITGDPSASTGGLT